MVSTDHDYPLIMIMETKYAYERIKDANITEWLNPGHYDSSRYERNIRKESTLRILERDLTSKQHKTKLCTAQRIPENKVNYEYKRMT